jgi:protein TonB
MAAYIVGAAVYRLRARFARFAFAAAVGLVMMGTLLLTLQMATSPRGRVQEGQRIADVGVARMDAGIDGSSESATTETAAATGAVNSPKFITPLDAGARTRPERFDQPIVPPALFAITFSDELELPVGIGIPTELEINLTAFELGQGKQLRMADGDYIPIVKAIPAFPARAASRGLEGYVVLEYTVTPNGSVEDVVVVESSSDLFEASAVAAAYRFKYKPRVVGGRPVHARGVRTKVSYKLEV